MRKAFGNQEVRISREILRKFRDLAKERDQYGSYDKLARAIRAEFPEMPIDTISGYLTVAGKASGFAFQLAMEEKISIKVLSEIAIGNLDPASQDILAMRVSSKPARKPCGRVDKAGASQVRRVKKILAEGYGDRRGRGKVGLSDAIAIAWGEVPVHSKFDEVKKTSKDFGGVLGELIDASNTFMAKLDEAMELIPISVLDTQENRMDLFHKLTVFANTLENSHRFVMERKKRFLADHRAHVVTEVAMDQRRKEGKE